MARIPVLVGMVALLHATGSLGNTGNAPSTAGGVVKTTTGGELPRNKAGDNIGYCEKTDNHCVWASRSETLASCSVSKSTHAQLGIEGKERVMRLIKSVGRRTIVSRQ
ncbi:hypothetical protein ANO11243_093600 [Dothideomycetidae sp. 11243]|nr:hypothetical protein ANO11243_093600 [fungal sp. No.11243]